MIYTAIKSLIIYLLLMLAVRIMGKRQLGDLQVSEFIGTLLLSEIAAAPITDNEIPIMRSVISITIIVIIEISIPLISGKSRTFRKIVEGSPSHIITKGVIDQKALKKCRITLDELLAALRVSGYSDVSDIDYAIIEADGQLSVFPKIEKRPPNCDELALNISSDGIAYPVIINGEVNKSGLSFLGKDETWLKNETEKLHKNIKDIYLYTLTDDGTKNIVYKDNM